MFAIFTALLNKTPPLTLCSNVIQSYVREGPTHKSACASNTHAYGTRHNTHDADVQTTAGYDAGIGQKSLYNAVDYYSSWDIQESTIVGPDGYCCGFDNTFCCDEAHSAQLQELCFEADCQLAPCSELHDGCIPATCFDQTCEEIPCQDSHGGRLLSAEPCFDIHHQYLPACTGDGCPIPAVDNFVIDDQTVSAAAQLAALTRATVTPLPPPTQTTQAQIHDYAAILNDFTNHNTPSFQYGNDSGISGLSRSNTTSLTDTEDESADEASTVGPSTNRKRAGPTRHICLWTHPVSCEACNLHFPTSAALHSHVDKDHIDRLDKDANNRFRCLWSACKRTHDQTFTAKPKLKRHVQTHTHHKPYQCQHCNTNMKTKDALEKHTRIHTGEAPYKCAECQKTFKTSTEHKTHMTAVHSNLKPHECPHCGQRFADSSNLSKHKKTHWMGSFKCLHQGCKAHMKRWDQIRRHFQTQGHCPELLQDGSEEQRKYKREMQESWLAIPEQQRLLMSRAGTENANGTVVQEKVDSPQVNAIEQGRALCMTPEGNEALANMWTAQKQHRQQQEKPRRPSCSVDIFNNARPLRSPSTDNGAKRVPLDELYSARNKQMKV